tara:strand:- start:3008 stop:3703 length:696 start_codon:yes stop_codon:yes gene_type:complete
MAYKKSPFKMMPKSPVLKALIGNQKNLNEGLKAAIKASPAKAHCASPVKQKGDVKLKDVPGKVAEGAKDLVNKIGNIKISTEEGRKRRKERRDLRKKQKEEKNSPVKQKMEMVEVDGKKVPKFAADGKGAGDLKKSSPAKGYKSAAQRKAVHANKADGGAGHPDKKKSPAKQMSKLKKSSPAKQCGGFGKAGIKAMKKTSGKSPAKQCGGMKKSPAKKYKKSPAKAHCNKK